MSTVTLYVDCSYAFFFYMNRFKGDENRVSERGQSWITDNVPSYDLNFQAICLSLICQMLRGGWESLYCLGTGKGSQVILALYLVFCVVFYLLLNILSIVLPVIQLTASDYLLSIFKLYA